VKIAQRRLDLLRPVHLAAVEADAVALGFEEACEPGRVARVPGFETGCGTDLLPLSYIFGYRGKEVVR
jgi:hypothetical protein